MKSKTPQRVRILTHETAQHRTYGVTRNLLTYFIRDGHTFYREEDRKQAAYYEKENAVLPHAFDAAMSLIVVPGVMYVTIKRDCVVVRKSVAFDWEEIQPAVLSALRASLFADAFDDVIVDDTLAPKREPADKPRAAPAKS